jgi:hypothetical protein
MRMKARVETRIEHAGRDIRSQDVGVGTLLTAANVFNTRGRFGAGNRKRIRAMILVLRYTGLGISDTAALTRGRP